MKTVCAAYKTYEQNSKNIVLVQIRAERKKLLVGYKEITCHFVFDDVNSKAEEADIDGDTSSGSSSSSSSSRR